MSDYTKSTNFATKDNLTPGDPLKIVRGTEIDTEFNNIATAIATKTDNASAAITGGSITGITDLAIADGGTGASTANAALNNLLPSQASASGKYLKSNGTDSSWDALDISTADITGTLPVANGGTGVTSSTGTGSVVLSNSPTLVTPALGTPASGVATNLTGLPLTTGVTGTLPIANGGTGQTTANAAFNALAPSQATASGKYLKSDGTNTSWDALDISTADITGTLPVANGGTGVTTSTGTGSVVLSNSPTLVTPALGTPSSGTLTNATGLPISTGVSGLGTGVATALAVNVGSAGAPVVNGGALGTPSSGTATNLTGLPLTTGVTGTLPTANGGTNLTSFTSGGVVYASSTSALATGSGLVFDGTNVGVGTTINATRRVNILSGTGITPLAAVGPNGYLLIDNAGSGENYYSASSAQIWVRSGTEQMRLTSTGLGIGTSSPSYKLDVNGQARISTGLTLTAATSSLYATDGTLSRYSTTNATYLNGNDAGWLGLQASGLQKTLINLYGSTEANNPNIINFYTNSVERARIDSSGNLLVGTTSQIRTGDRMSVLGTGGTVATFQQNTNTSGYHGIAVNLQANGNNTSTYAFWGNTSGVGNWYLYGNGTTSYSSDERLKKNIVTTRNGYIDDVMKLRVVKYNWKKDDDSTPKELGLIAQEVEKVFPSLVQDDINPVEDGGEIYKQVKQSVIPFILLKAIQELKAEFDAYKASHP